MTVRPDTSLAKVLKQTQPFHTPQQEAYLSVVRTAAELSHSLDLLLRPFGITQPQYNVLRILRGAGRNGLGRNEIRDRMVNSMPDMSRLLDRMEKLNWLTRTRSDEDRRHVPTAITRQGLALLGKIDQPLAELHARQFTGMHVRQIEHLLVALQLIRSNQA